MEAAELKKQTQDVIIKRYEDVLAGRSSYNEWLEYLLDIMEYYIKDYTAKMGRTKTPQDFEDYMQEGRLAVIKKAPEYDPHISMPSSYFTLQIEAGQQAFAKKSGQTSYYVSEAVTLNKIAREAGYSGINDPALSANVLIELSHEPATTVLNTLEMLKMSSSSLEAVTENIDIESTYKNPEEIALENERNEFVFERWNELSPFEQFLLFHIVLVDPPVKGVSEKKNEGVSRRKMPWLKVGKERLSYCEMCVLLNSKEHPEYREIYKKYLPKKITTQTLQNIVNSALAKLAQATETQDYLEFEEDDIDFDEIEQATESEIEKAMMENLLDLTNELAYD